MSENAPDPWKAIRFKTLDQLVTEVKLSGSGGQLHGFTTPEGWPFRLMIVVGSPGNERVVQIADEFAAKMAEIASFTIRADNPKNKGGA